MTTAADFLRAVTPPGTHMTVVAIDPKKEKGACVGMGFDADTIAAVQAFIDAHPDHNLYWTPNPLKQRVDKKPTKSDVAEMRWVHLDLDDPTDEALARLRSFQLPPTFIVFSGGGYQAFWRLREPIRVNGNLAELEAANRAVMSTLGGDKGTYNIDRIMRLPGTTNWPTKTKLAKGREPIEARLVEHHADRAYALDEFAAPTPLKKADRSADLLTQVSKAVRAGRSDDEIHAEFDSHAHAVDQADPQRAVQRCIDKARAGVDEVIAMLNEHHALVWVEGKLAVMWKQRMAGALPTLSSIADVGTYWSNHPASASIVKCWLRDPRRSEYRTMVFRPDVADTAPDYNLFGGWGVRPAAGSCALFLQHLREVVCADDADKYDYVLQWLADAVQRPAQKPGTAIGMGGRQGTGKGAVFRYLTPIFGRHCLQVAGSELLTGRFNDILAGQLMIFADEAVFGGDRRGLNKLKSYITEERISVERKHVPAFSIENYARFIFASNSDHFAPAEFDDRRFVPLQVAERRRDDAMYWNALAAEQAAGGPAALLHYLLHEVKLTRNLRRIPATEELAEQKLLGLDDAGQFWRKMLLKESHTHKVGSGNSAEWFRLGWGEPVPTENVMVHYDEHVRRSRVAYPMSIDGMGRAIKKYIPSARKSEARADERKALGLAERTYVYRLPKLEEARREFEAALRQAVEWPGDESGPVPKEPEDAL